eukprot:3194715-Rhodomonas_salina.1
MAAASARKDEQSQPTFVVRVSHSVGSPSPKKTAAAPISPSCTAVAGTYCAREASMDSEEESILPAFPILGCRWP